MLLITCVLVTGCGKKGAPLPPFQRIPVAPPELTVTRIEEDVYAQFKVPTVNVDGVGPADVARVELYAITADRAPEVRDPRDLRELSTLVATQEVRRPVPPPPPLKEGMPPVPAPPPDPGVDQGAVVVMRESLTPEVRTPVTLPVSDDARAARNEAVHVPRPLVAPTDAGGPQRYYYAVAVSQRGRSGPLSGLVPAPLGPTSSALPRPEVTFDEKTMTIRWTPAADARGVVEAAPPDVLPSKPLAPSPPPTTYDVYELPKSAPSATGVLAIPAPLTPAPTAALEHTQENITLGAERCFVVRPVDIVSGIHVRGPASQVVCASFADTFVPSPPGRLDAVAGLGMISLIWEPSEAHDLAGYLVLRGEPGSATLTPLTADPLKAPSYDDRSARPGGRYAYAVVAVDKAGNRSAESNRVEETARQ